MPLQSRLLHTNLDDVNPADVHPRNPRYLPLPTYGRQVDTEYEYIHPRIPHSMEGHQLQAQGYRLPAPSGYTHIAPLSTGRQLNPPLKSCHSLPPVSSLLHKATPLSSDIANTLTDRPQAVPANAQVPVPNAHYASHYKPEPRKGTHSSSASTQKSQRNPSTNLKGGASKKIFSSQELVAVARAVVEEMPFLAAYGEKASTWTKVCNNLRENGFRHSISTDLIRHKAEALVHFKKVSRW